MMTSLQKPTCIVGTPNQFTLNPMIDASYFLIDFLRVSLGDYRRCVGENKGITYAALPVFDFPTMLFIMGKGIF